MDQHTVEEGRHSSALEFKDYEKLVMLRSYCRKIRGSRAQCNIFSPRFPTQENVVGACLTDCVCFCPGDCGDDLEKNAGFLSPRSSSSFQSLRNLFAFGRDAHSNYEVAAAWKRGGKFCPKSIQQFAVISFYSSLLL